ncbi:hypothetical protein [Bacillus infantis]|uniref:hypothetical protein n=1 Tax=Bacillus infantis TaxID=324767 RepID=UPI002E86CB48|nr:hypothetical protein [Bacillus infantis]
MISLALGIPQTAAGMASKQEAVKGSELLILSGKREFLCAVKKTEGSYEPGRT